VFFSALEVVQGGAHLGDILIEVVFGASGIVPLIFSYFHIGGWLLGVDCLIWLHWVLESFVGNNGGKVNGHQLLRALDVGTGGLE
jgi:predicted branched-subunit amino acid permease